MNIGVVGLGSWGCNVYQEYKKLEDEGVIDTVFSCDNVKPADFQNYQDMLKKVDGVHLCLPNKVHYSIAKDILLQGKHILVEKPMTLCKKEAHHLIEIASEQDLILQVGYILRFANVVRKAKEIYDNDTLGGIYYATIRWTASIPSMQETDIVWDFLPHPLDTIHFITGSFPNESTQLMKRSFKNLGEVAFLNLDYDTFFANVVLSWLDPVKRREVCLYGSKGSLWMECTRQELKIFDKEAVRDISIENNPTIRGEALNFIDCLKDGKNRFNSHIIGLQNTEVIEKIMENERISSVIKEKREGHREKI